MSSSGDGNGSGYRLGGNERTCQAPMIDVPFTSGKGRIEKEENSLAVSPSVSMEFCRRRRDDPMYWILLFIIIIYQR